MIGRIRDRRLFEALRSTGRPLRRGLLTVTYLPVDAEGTTPVVAFAIGRRFGNVVERNRARRRVRAAFHEATQREVLPRSVAILVRCRREALDVPFDRLVAEAAEVLRAIGGDTRATAPC